MVTKTLTITEEAYRLLLDLKLESESFSQEIKRLLSKRRKKTLKDFTGILSDSEGKEMLDDLKKIKAMNLEFSRRKIK
ncbi:antitoxin VapB family protein [Nanoarchaeota archaeon]